MNETRTMLSRVKCGCKMYSEADPVTQSTIRECKRHRVKREKNKIEKFASEQIDLPPEFAQVLNDNFMDLI